MRRITVIVKPGSKTEKVIEGAKETPQEDTLIIYTKAPAKEGKANQAVIKALAEYLHQPQSNIHIKFGLTAREKIVEIG